MKNLLTLFLITVPFLICAQQVSDLDYKPSIQNPEYNIGAGPVVFVDEGHYNFHTKDNRYRAFSNLLERDGYSVKAYKGEFDTNELKKGKILVISNALNKINVNDWFLPNPSAFSKEEIEVVKKWVSDGGSLFLIADHMPMAGAAQDMAKAFDFEFTNGFAMDTISRGPAIFNYEEKTLHKNVITSGRTATEKVKQIVSFTGQAFRIPKDATPLLTFNEKYVNMLPDTAWVFDKSTKIYSAKGWSQGAYKKFGKGRIVFFGEAAMFTAQLAGAQKYKVGMNNPVAPENYQLLLNIIHWLDGKLEQ